MKSFLILMICSLLLLQACKKEKQTSSNLTISGFGAVAFASGDAISIFGSGFDPDANNNTVLFNGVAGEVASATPNRLQVIAPLLITSGKITVTVHGKSATSSQTYTVVNVLQGTYSNSFILTADKKYLLRGSVVFNSKLSIEAGTVIYGEKLTHGSLTANDVDFEGTQAKPIIFTSDQAPGNRYPGDWTGVTVGTTLDENGSVIANGILEYVRVEYAGYHQTGQQGTALNISISANGIYQYLQASYSSGSGITIAGYGQNNNGIGFIHHIVAFGCSGDDFRFSGSGTIAQYGLGIKDPYFADILKGNGIAVVEQNNVGPNILSNFTMVGYNPEARNILGVGPTVTNNAGSGILFGNNYILFGVLSSSYDAVAIYNSVIAANWQAGVTLAGVGNSDWTNYPKGTIDQVVNCFITGTSAPQLPFRGGAFGHLVTQSTQTENQYFADISADPNRTLFASLNDTTKALSFSQQKDDLGIKTLTDYSQLNHPGVLPAPGSVLLSGAKFPLGSDADNPYLNKDVTYVGAFGTVDWTQQWCNFNPQITQY